ncbi:MAG: phosphotransferase [Acidimicrobiales bacterium]|nr:phosphotransferase [Acidimicrobiales bacterium]
MTPSTTVPTGAHELTGQWLTAVLGRQFAGASVEVADAQPVGTGQVADSVRLSLAWSPPGAGPTTMVAKVTSASPTSRASSRLTRTYEIEVGFYRDLAPSLPVHTPRCYYAGHEPDDDGYVVLLEDAAPATQGDQMAGCSVDEASAALDELALLHGPRWGDPALTDLSWLDRHGDDHADNVTLLLRMALPTFLDRFTDRLSPDAVAATGRLADRLPAYLARDRGPTVVHGDFRVDNLLFGAGRVFVLDWQTVTLGPALSDVSYFLGGSLPIEVRRREERDLVGHYHQRLVAAGGDLSWDDCWWGYRRFAFDGLVMAIGASFLVERTDRGDEMFAAMAERSARHALDLGTEELIAG